MFTVRLVPPVKTDDEKNVHGTSPMNANRGYGMPSVATCPMFVNTSVKTSIRTIGARATQAIPRTDCL